MTVKALEEFDITRKDAERAKNMFALGLLSWLYNRPVESTIAFLGSKFAAKPEIMKANIAAFQAGWNYGETTEAFSVQYEVKPAQLRPGTYRNITGNSALAIGLVAASRRSGLPLFLGSYPITPASDILHELSKLKRYAKVVIPEMNLGQLAQVIRGRYLVDAIPYNKVRGLPFTASELESMLEEVVKNG